MGAINSRDPADLESGLSGQGAQVIPLNYFGLINTRDPADPESGLSGQGAQVIKGRTGSWFAKPNEFIGEREGPRLLGPGGGEPRTRNSSSSWRSMLLQRLVALGLEVLTVPPNGCCDAVLPCRRTVKSFQVTTLGSYCNDDDFLSTGGAYFSNNRWRIYMWKIQLHIAG